MPEYVYYGGNKSDMYGAAFVGVLRLLRDNPNLDPEVANVLAGIVDPNKLVALYDLAAEDEQEFTVETPRWAKSDEERKKFAGFVVGGKRGGLACCAAVVAHEVHHVEMNNDSAGKTDGDFDQIADTLESSLDDVVTRTDDKDTYSFSSIPGFDTYAGYGDNEIRARKKERKHARERYFREKDWSNPGFQSKMNRYSYDNVED